MDAEMFLALLRHSAEFRDFMKTSGWQEYILRRSRTSHHVQIIWLTSCRQGNENNLWSFGLNVKC